MAARTWLAIILSCLVLFVYTKYFAPTPPVIQNPVVPATSPVAKAPDGTVESVSEPVVWGTNTQTTLEKVSVIENDQWVMEISNLGANIRSLKLKHYREEANKKAPPISLINSVNTPNLLNTKFTHPELKSFNESPFTLRVDQTNSVLEAFSENQRFKIRKLIKWNAHDYQFSEKIKIEQKGQTQAEVVLGQLWVPLGYKSVEHDSQIPIKSWEVVFYQNESIKREPLEKFGEAQKLYQGNTPWVAFGNRYFATILANESLLNPDVVLKKDGNFTGAIAQFPVSLKDGSVEFSFLLYSGPKQSGNLGFSPGMKGLIDYGMFSSIGYPLLEILRFFYRFIGNYGIAIILLTIFVRILFYPLSVKSFQSMKKMQRLQPEIQKLKEKYGEDKERINREQLALFKAHKVNPAGGCLPMFIQMPVFIALWAVLSNSIELFQAPFFGWIQDLSSKDPYYIFPILMGGAMVLQQKLTPTVGMDPTQAKMMMIMPLFFTFFMINLPSGLTIYMFVSTLLGVLQQWLITKKSSDLGENQKLAPVPGK